jgi:hypothetical protein
MMGVMATAAITARAATIPTLKDDPRVVKYLAEHAAATRTRDAAVSERARVVNERADLDDKSVSTLVAFGKLTQGEVDTRRTTLDREIATLDQQIAGFDRAIGQLEIDGRALRAGVEADIRQRLGARAREVLAEMADAFVTIENGYVELRAIAGRGVADLPLPLLEIGVTHVRKALRRQG